MIRYVKAHYVYRVSDRHGNYYYGSRTAHTEVELDKYSGSGVWPSRMRKQGECLCKEVVSVHPTRRDACKAEAGVIAAHIDDPYCKNATKAAPVPSDAPRGIAPVPWKSIVDSEMWEVGAKAIILWLEVVAFGGVAGISSKFLAKRCDVSILECDRLLRLVSARTPDSLPSITQDATTWKLTA